MEDEQKALIGDDKIQYTESRRLQGNMMVIIFSEVSNMPSAVCTVRLGSARDISSQGGKASCTTTGF